jgi:hypothetical protein
MSVLYQVAFLEENHGRFNLNSKKKVTWQFRVQRPNDGTHNQVEEEHAVSLAWSKRTGKQEVYFDDQEVWFGRKQGASVFDYSWTTREGMFTFHILATSAPKLNDGFRKYDLLINRRLFVDLPLYSPERGPVTDIGAGTSGTREHPGSIFEVLYPNGYPLAPSSTIAAGPPPTIHNMNTAPPTSMVPYQTGDYNTLSSASIATNQVEGNNIGPLPTEMVPYYQTVDSNNHNNNYLPGAIAGGQSKHDDIVDLLG